MGLRRKLGRPFDLLLTGPEVLLGRARGVRVGSRFCIALRQPVACKDRRFSRIVILYGGIGVINVELEVLAFRIMPPSQVFRDTAIGLAQAAVVAAILGFGFLLQNGPIAKSEPPGLARGLWFRVPLVGLAYVVLFMVAGHLIYPYVKHYYQSGFVVFPPFGQLLAIEFGRGLVYAAALAPLLRQMSGRRGHATLVAGIALSILVVALLLTPAEVPLRAEIIPWDVRKFHFVEILWSNFVLGVIAALLLVKPAVRDRFAPTGGTEPESHNIPRRRLPGQVRDKTLKEAKAVRGQPPSNESCRTTHRGGPAGNAKDGLPQMGIVGSNGPGTPLDTSANRT